MQTTLGNLNIVYVRVTETSTGIIHHQCLIPLESLSEYVDNLKKKIDNEKGIKASDLTVETVNSTFTISATPSKSYWRKYQ